jgi:hypothetical protein
LPISVTTALIKGEKESPKNRAAVFFLMNTSWEFNTQKEG